LVYNQALIEIIQEQTKKPFPVLCERHPHKEVSHYCALHDMIICDECVRYEHSDHAGRHISDLKNAEIEKYIVEINADINLWQSKVSGLLEDI
jgi:hypothetical protein